MLGAAVPADTATDQLRVRSQQVHRRVGENRVKDGYTLGTLRATGGPPAGLASRSVLAVRSDTEARSGRRSTSLFDLPKSGQSVLSRLSGQVRSVSPLTAGLSSDEGGSALQAGGAEGRGGLSTSADAQAALRARYRGIDTSSRFLQAQSTRSRTSQGFGIQLPERGISILG
ncbi:hypothetical protein ACFL6X_02985 [Candidatus Latescibacterota bacterium]